MITSNALRVLLHKDGPCSSHAPGEEQLPGVLSSFTHFLLCLMLCASCCVHIKRTCAKAKYTIVVRNDALVKSCVCVLHMAPHREMQIVLWHVQSVLYDVAGVIIKSVCY